MNKNEITRSPNKNQSSRIREWVVIDIEKTIKEVENKRELSIHDLVKLSTEVDERVGILSWRWDFNHEKKSRNLANSISRSVKMGLKLLLADVVSIDQNDENLIQRVTEFSQFYETQKVVLIYGDFQDSFDRVWLTFERHLMRWNKNVKFSDLTHESDDKIKSFIDVMSAHVSDLNDFIMEAESECEDSDEEIERTLEWHIIKIVTLIDGGDDPSEEFANMIIKYGNEIGVDDGSPFSKDKMIEIVGSRTLIDFYYELENSQQDFAENVLANALWDPCRAGYLLDIPLVLSLQAGLTELSGKIMRVTDEGKKTDPVLSLLIFLLIKNELSDHFKFANAANIGKEILNDIVSNDLLKVEVQKIGGEMVVESDLILGANSMLIKMKHLMSKKWLIDFKVNGNAAIMIDNLIKDWIKADGGPLELKFETFPALRDFV